MEKKLTRDELLMQLIDKAKDVFTTSEQKYDILKILKESTNFRGKNHLFLVQCYFQETTPLFFITKEEALEQAEAALKDGNAYSCYYLYRLLKEKNPVRARNYLRICCDHAYPIAYLEMAKCKHYGNLFYRDYEGAIQYYQKAALSGLKEGYEGLMSLYLELGEIEKEKEVYQEAKKKGFDLLGVVE